MPSDEDVNEAASCDIEPDLTNDISLYKICFKCSKSIIDGISSSVQCIKCKMWIHSKCSVSKDVLNLLAKINADKKNKFVFVGAVAYICGPCVASLESTDSNIKSPQTSCTPMNSVKQQTTASSIDVKSQAVQTFTSIDVASSNSSPVCSFDVADVGTVQAPSGAKSHINEKVTNQVKFTQTVLSNSHLGVSSATEPALSKTSISAPSNVFNSRNSETDNYQPATKPICSYYRRGKCRHGVRGNNMINGQKCKFLHPKKCLRFCKFGSNKSRGGCDGSACGYFHPILCSNSVKYGHCLVENCTFNHLKFTHRGPFRNPLYEPENRVSWKSRGEGLEAFPKLQPTFPNEVLQHPRSSKHQSSAPSSGLYTQMQEMSSAIKQIQGCLGQLLQKNGWPRDAGDPLVQAPYDGNFPNQTNDNWSTFHPVNGQQLNVVPKNSNLQRCPQ